MREILDKVQVLVEAGGSAVGKRVRFAALIFMAGWSLYQAFDCLMKARELRHGDDHRDDPPPEAPEPPPDDGLKASLVTENGVVDLSREEVTKILAEKA